ncbi:hypothetical protein [Pseudomonas marginalis]|uniref:hypothetical protein n=1 Tax=Pseudomonas marginalis TaxID=298 RepID=UPI0011B744ED|nr:hypothetical protein [Pseudomonas marginalis]KAA8555108.1 hypothetical protein FX984_01726 [Pseudomonas marginalis]TWR71865.1 hypothetical protein FIV40_09170 [Pseudomonas marginalis]
MTLFAFGDSITAFAGATSAAKAFISQLALALGLSLDNSGVSTAMCIDQGAALIQKTPAAGDMASIAFGTNDQAKYDVDPAKRGYYIDCLRSYAVRMASGVKNATPANGVTFTGSYGSGYAYGTYGLSSAGSKASVSVAGTSVALGFLRQYNNSGTFRVKIDGVDKGTFAIGGDVRTLLGASFGPMALQFSGLSAGTHSVELEVVSADAQNVVFFQWYSAMQPKNKVVIYNIPHARAYTYGGSDANVDNYNADIASLVTSLSAAGLPVYLADVNSVMTSADFNDNVHPNDYGHAKWYQAGYNKLYTAPAIPPAVTFSETKIYLGSDGLFYGYAGGNYVKLP